MPDETAAAELTRAWLDAAGEDLALAARSLQPPPLPSGAAFHSQQAAEKAFKAFLTYHNRPFRRIHDLAELLRDCIMLAPDLVMLEPPAKDLSQFAIVGRYPDIEGAPRPDTKEAEKALRASEQIVQSVVDRLPRGMRL